MIETHRLHGVGRVVEALQLLQHPFGSEGILLLVGIGAIKVQGMQVEKVVLKGHVAIDGLRNHIERTVHYRLRWFEGDNTLVGSDSIDTLSVAGFLLELVTRI